MIYRWFCFDIETIADIPLIRQIHFPDNKLSNSETLNLYKEKLLENSQGKSDFVPYTFQLPISLAIIAVGDNFRIQKITTLDRPQFRPHIITRQFWQLWQKHSLIGQAHPTFVTFNGRGFDLPVMEQCAFRYGIDTAGAWFRQKGPSYQQARNRYNTESHFDLMDFLTNFGATRYTGGLDLAATLLGKPGKMDTKGSMVQELWDQGEKLRIDDYCLCDSLDTYFCFLRTRVLCGDISLEQESQIVQYAHDFLEKSSAEWPVLTDYLERFRYWKSPSDEEDGFYEEP